MKYRIGVDLTGIGQHVAALVQGAMPLVQQAVVAVGNEAAARWKSAVMHAPLWQGEKEAYVQSIQIVDDGPFAVRVFADYKHAGAIEEGRPAFDQKVYLQTSLRVRKVSGDGPHAGKKYLIIPFRHNVPNNTAHAPAMPEKVYNLASKLTASRITGTIPTPNLQGRIDAQGMPIMVNRHTYKWGGRLPSGLAEKAAPHHKTDRYAGMVRMDTTPGGAGSGVGKRSSAYLTFRIMGEWSSGWVRKPQPGLYLAREVAKEIEPLAETAIKQAMALTVQGALGQS